MEIFRIQKVMSEFKNHQNLKDKRKMEILIKFGKNIVSENINRGHIYKK